MLDREHRLIGSTVRPAPLRARRVLATKRLLLSVAVLMVLAGLGFGPLVSMVWWNLGYIDLSHLATPQDPGGTAIRYTPPPVDSSGLARRAEERFREAIRWWPAATPPRIGLGEALVRQGRYDEAAATLQAVTDTSGWTQAGFAAGSALMFAGQHQDGLDRWMAAASDPLARLRLSIVVFEQSDWTNYHPERWDDAVSILKTTVQTQATSPTLTKMLDVQLAESYWRIEQPDNAIATLEQILTFDPGDGRTRSTLAWILLTEGHDEEARTQADLTLTTDPNWRAHYVRGLLALQQCRTDDAIIEFRAGLTFPADEYRFANQWLQLGNAYWEQGRTADAMEQWAAYQRQQPRDPSVEDLMTRAQNDTLERHCTGTLTP